MSDLSHEEELAFTKLILYGMVPEKIIDAPGRLWYLNIERSPNELGGYAESFNKLTNGQYGFETLVDALAMVERVRREQKRSD